MGDPSFASNVLLVPFDGADGSTTFVDESNAGVTLTAGGSAQLDTSSFKYGTASGLFNGSTDYVGAGATTSLDFFNGDKVFTWEAWVDGSATNQVLMFAGASSTIQWSGSNLQWIVYINTSGQLEFQFRNGTASPTIYNGGAVTFTDFVHLAVCSNGTTVRGFIGGTQVFSGSITGASSSTTTPSGEIGRLGSANLHFNGRMDDLRIKKGVALYTSAFTPPTAAHPTTQLFQFRSQIPGLLGAPSVLSSVTPNFAARSAIPSLLGSPQARLKTLNGVYASLPSLLGVPKTSVLTDVSSLLTDRTERYVMVVSGSPPVEIPVSSWSGTRQVDRRNFLQCSVPNSSEYVQEITARLGSETFTVYRVGFIEDRRFDFPVASAALETSVNSSGGLNETLTIQGYEDASTGKVSPTTRKLSNLRQTSQTLGGNFRARCDIDWIVQPGQTVDADGFTFTADYINYFVPRSGDVYMDVGSRG